MCLNAPNHIPDAVHTFTGGVGLSQALTNPLDQIVNVFPVPCVLPVYFHNLLGYLSAGKRPCGASQNIHAGPEQFALAEYHMALLSRHGGVQIAGIAERAQCAIYRVYVVLDFGNAFTKLLCLIEKVRPLGQKAVDCMAVVCCPSAGQVSDFHPPNLATNAVSCARICGAVDT